MTISEAHYFVLFSVLAALGGLVAVHYLWILAYGTYACFFRPGKNIKKTFGAWAVVTGATDGIGKAMTFEFARKGVNVVLLSRSPEKLEACRNEILAKYPTIEVRTLSMDFSNFNESNRQLVKTFLKDIDVGVLVNNVGISYPYTKYFHELDESRVDDLMSLNVGSTTWMTNIVLPGMVSRKRGAIVNISSAAGVSVSPLLAEYGAAKSYIAMFSKALDAELSKFRIRVQCQVPMFVATKLAKIKHTSLFVPSPSAYARAAVAAIGYDTVISPYWSHSLQIYLLTHLPERLVSFGTMWMHQGIRAAGMKKDARLQEESSKVKTT